MRIGERRKKKKRRDERRGEGEESRAKRTS